MEAETVSDIPNRNTLCIAFEVKYTNPSIGKNKFVKFIEGSNSSEVFRKKNKQIEINEYQATIHFSPKKTCSIFNIYLYPAE